MRRVHGTVCTTHSELALCNDFCTQGSPSKPDNPGLRCTTPCGVKVRDAVRRRATAQHAASRHARRHARYAESVLQHSPGLSAFLADCPGNQAPAMTQP